MNRLCEKKWRIDHWKRLLSLGLAVVLIMTQFPAVAVGNIVSAGGEIVSFSVLPEETRMREVLTGISLGELQLPNKLEAKVAVLEENKEETVDIDSTDKGTATQQSLDRGADQIFTASNSVGVKQQEQGGTGILNDGITDGSQTDNELPDQPIQPSTPSDTIQDEELTNTPETNPDSTVSEKTVSVPVEWISVPDYDSSTPGTYTFTAVPDNGYWLATDVEAPVITVTVLPQAVQKKILSWKWNDPNQVVAEGVLALPGVSRENPIDRDTLISMLPSSIEAVLEHTQVADSEAEPDTVETVALTWSSDNFKKNEDGSWPVEGSYVFTATPESGYILAGNAPKLEIAVTLGGARILPAGNVFTKLEIREGTADGAVVVDLLDSTSLAGGWALKPGSDYYIWAELTAPQTADYIQIRYGNADGTYSGAIFANVPGGSYSPGAIAAHDYFDELTAYTNFADPTYGSNGTTEYPLQDGEMVYHIKAKSEAAEKNVILAIGLIVKDAVYDGSGTIPDAISISAGSYHDGIFTAAQDSTQSFELKVAQKGAFEAYMGHSSLSASIGETSTASSTSYISNTLLEILYDQVEFDLTYPAKAQLYIGAAKLDSDLGVMEVGEAVENDNGQTKTVHVTVKNGLKALNKNGSCIVRLDFPLNAGFNPGEKYELVLSNVKLTMGGNIQDIPIRSTLSKIVYTLSAAGRDETTMVARDRTVYNHTIDGPAQEYIVPLGTAAIENKSVSQDTPYEKTFEAQYNITNTAVNVSFITIPKGTGETPRISWTGVDAHGNVKSGEVVNPSSNGGSYFLLSAAELGIVSFTGATAELGKLPASFKSASSTTSWIFANNAAGAFGSFTTDEPGIQVVSNYRLYNTDPALRERENGDLSVQVLGTSTDDCIIGWSGVPKLNGNEFTSSINAVADENATITGNLITYTAAQNGKHDGKSGTSQIAMNPVLYLTLPQGMTVVENGLKFKIEKRNFLGRILETADISHGIENISYFNTTGDGVSIYKITFQEGTRIGNYDGEGNYYNLQYTIPLLPSKSLATRRYLLSELITVADSNQPNASIVKVNGQSINYVSQDKYGINGGNSLGTLSLGTDDQPTGFGVQQAAEVNVYSAVTVTKINGESIPEERWYAYSSDPNSIALLGKNSEGRLRLQISNTSDTPGTAMRIVLPIPQQSHDMGDMFMDTPSGFTMSMAYDDRSSTGGFSMKYIKVDGSYDSIGDKTNLVSYEECSQAEANAVLFTADSVARGEYYLYLDFTVTNGLPQAVDIWRPVYAYTVATDRRVNKGSYVASEVAASSISGVAFADVNRNGKQDTGEDGAADVTVIARDAKNRIVSTKTDAHGNYQFLAIRESTINMTFTLNAEGQKTLRFNVPALPDGTSGIVSTVTPSVDGLSAYRTFVATAGEEKVHAAVDGFVSLSYDANGAAGNLPKTGSHVKGTQATVAVKPDNLSKTGYTFKCWNTKPDGAGITYQPGAKMSISENTTLYAIWQTASYTVNFNYRGATGGNDEASRVVEHGKKYGAVKLLPCPTKTGYTFFGWTISPTGTVVTVKDETVFSLGADTTLYALWTPKSVSVNYNSNGGTGSITPKTVNWESAVLPTDDETNAITKNGYTLSGWTYSGSSVTKTDTYGGLAVMDSPSSITLTAQWQTKTGYTVKYALDGGSIDGNAAVSDKTGVNWTQSSLFPVKNPDKPNYSFIGWKCGNDAVTGASTYGDLAKTDTVKDITLTAQWELRMDNTVIYNTNGGSPISEKTGVKNEDKNLLPTENTIRQGYELTGWKAGDKNVTEDTVYNTLTTDIMLTLAAQWKAKEYTITYTPGNGDTIPNATKGWADSGLLSAQPNRSGYIFDGWYFESTKVTAASTVSSLIPEDDKNIIPLVAKWNERTYTVIYDSQGGTSFTPKSGVKYTTTGLLPDVQPAKTGYTFTGWYCEGTEVKMNTDCGSLLASDKDPGVTLTARWEAKTGFTVQYDTDGGVPSPTSKTVAWDAINLLPTDTITKTGYTFKGWLSGRTTVTNATAFSVLAANDQPGTSVTLVAQWEAKEGYTVKYNADGGSAIGDKTGVEWTDDNLFPPADPARTGYDFVKWQFGTADVNIADTYGKLAQTDTTFEITLKAVWEVKDGYKVTYNTDGGSTVPDKTPVKWTDAGLLPTEVPTKSGSVFGGWQYNGTTVSNTDTYGKLAVTDNTMSITLTVVWNAVANNTVIYETGGGTVFPSKINVKASDNNLLPVDVPEKPGYTFKNWKHGDTVVTDNTIYSSLTSTDTVTLTAQWEEKSYTISYLPDNGTTIPDASKKWTDSSLLPASDPVKGGYIFDGWFFENTKVTGDMTVSALIPKDDKTTITLTVHWTPRQTDNPDIWGTVTDEDDKPVSDAQVRLTQGADTIYGPVTTESNGGYLFTEVKAGIYNLVAQKGDQIVTKIITVTDSSLIENLKMPSQQKNSVLEVVGADTPAVVVGNLDEIAKDTPLSGGQSSLTITLTVQKEPELAAGKEQEHTAIRNAAGRAATILYLDATLMRQVDSNQPENIGDSNNVVLEVVIPYDFSGKENVKVYRYHGDAHAFTRLSAKPSGALTDKTCFFDEDAGLIHLYAMKYSTYAITYTTGSSGGENPGGGNTSGGSGSDYNYYSITLEPGNGGGFSPNTNRYRIREGMSAGFSIIPNTGYQIVDVKVDGRSVGAVSEYLFRNVQRDHTLSASFEKIPDTPDIPTPPLTPDTPTPTPPPIPSGPNMPTPGGGIQPGDPPAGVGITEDKPGASVPETIHPKSSELEQIKKDVLDDLEQKREETIAGLPDTLTEEQRKDAVDEINRIYNETAKNIEDAGSAGEVSDAFNQAFLDAEDAFAKTESLPLGETETAKPFVLISFILALLAILFAIFNLRRRKDCKRSEDKDDETFYKHNIIAIVMALAAVITFLLTTGWHGIILCNWWTILVAVFTVFTFIISMRKKKRAKES